MSPGRRNQGGEAVHEFERCQDLADASTRPRLGALIDQVLRIDLPQPFLRKGRAGALAQQALQPLAVVGFDAHAGVEGEAAAVLAQAHMASPSALSSKPRRTKRRTMRWRIVP